MSIKKFQSLWISFLSNLSSIATENKQNSIPLNAILRILKLFKQINLPFYKYLKIYGIKNFLNYKILLVNPKFLSVEILLNKLRDQRLLNLIYLNFLCVSFDELACLHEWSRTERHMRPTNMPLTPLDECARDSCILVRTCDPHDVRVSCCARFLPG